MTSSRQSFRRWWQPPRKISDREEDRSVTFLELFYDLVYVVLISQIAHALSLHVDLPGVAGFAFLFSLIWLAWLNGAMYHDLHGNDDLRTRVFTFMQMFTVRGDGCLCPQRPWRRLDWLRSLVRRIPVDPDLPLVAYRRPRSQSPPPVPTLCIGVYGLDASFRAFCVRSCAVALRHVGPCLADLAGTAAGDTHSGQE